MVSQKNRKLENRQYLSPYEILLSYYFFNTFKFIDMILTLALPKSQHFFKIYKLLVEYHFNHLGRTY